VSTLRVVHTPDAPAAIGPYSQAVVAGGVAYCSGQIPVDPNTGEVVPGSVGAQATRALHNLDAVLRAAGSSRDRVVRCTVYLTSMDDFAEVNAAYAEFFGEARPARATVAVVGLPKGVAVEIDAIAIAAD
jgi:2-iminobutanoate/2-iminopropanoate deaminase